MIFFFNNKKKTIEFQSRALKPYYNDWLREEERTKGMNYRELFKQKLKENERRSPPKVSTFC